jgi:hypothetical protein
VITGPGHVNPRRVSTPGPLVPAPPGRVRRAGVVRVAIRFKGGVEPLWLQAQAVPSATLVPCLSPLPAGWTVANVAVNDGRSLVTLDHNQAGPAAVELRLSAACDPAGTLEVPSGQPGVRRYQRTENTRSAYSAIWYDQFPGGCVTTRAPNDGFGQPIRHADRHFWGKGLRRSPSCAGVAHVRHRANLEPATSDRRPCSSLGSRRTIARPRSRRRVVRATSC